MSEHTTQQKVALVTGANKGIGRAAAAQLAALGMTVLIGARDPRRGEQAAAALRAEGGDVHAITLDVTDPATARAAARPRSGSPSSSVRRTWARCSPRSSRCSSDSVVSWSSTR